jgi:hypothetical protein
MSETIQNILSTIERNKKLLGITLYEKASIADISSFEKRKGIDLPDDLRTFYSYCNGFESEEDLFRIIPLKEILENKQDNFMISQEDFHIAEYLIYCDMWTLAIDRENRNNYSIYRKAKDQPPLINSFSIFLERFLNSGVGGLYKWEEDIYPKPI